MFLIAGEVLTRWSKKLTGRGVLITILLLGLVALAAAVPLFEFAPGALASY